jgi:hypothetical protein
MNLICSVENCGHLAERTGLCATHSREARKSSAPKTKARKTRIAKQSEEGKERMAVYNAINRMFLIMNLECGVCGGNSEEVHHKKGRDGILLFDIRFWLPVCRRCHERITIESKWAYNEGLSLSRHQNETI